MQTVLIITFASSKAPHRQSLCGSPVDVVRLACHFRELSQVLPGVAWLHKRGYRVGLNLMQIADRSQAEVEELAKMASATATEVLYFADSMGSMAVVANGPSSAGILDEIVALRDRFSGVVIEFHDFWTHRDAIVAFLDALDFTVGHWHVNTSVVPNRATGAGVIEVTLTPHPGEGRRTDLHPLDDFIPGTEALTEVIYD